MLERVLKHPGIGVEIVGIDNIIVSRSEDIARTHGILREVYLGGIDTCKELAIVVGEAFPELVAHIVGSLAIPYHLYRLFDLYRAVIGGNEQAYRELAKFLQKYVEVGMLKPTLREGEVGVCIVG